ncbi:MAG: UDP-N-acetylglucosamine 1-carboxyvinyltransferase [Deltaproteobacteria bacterium]|uniref:UDP-N-acetylglucosamine 1-carboxyvinyltransferase n=1 Tax=Candidatus Zymogenus saltonus TaxID=2844893 RepID=A0A9D8PNF9_9DELT|nr:UDP-N-acetylglucosamine 1-carboxyvinyltransferase [Candidatus Zymogenus saltonus]
MKKMVIRGGVPLKGRLRISGSKNAALPIIISSIMAPGRSEFLDVPDLMDIRTTEKLLTELGAEVSFDDAFVVDSSTIKRHEAPWDEVRKMRASFLVLGAMISRFGVAEVALPGGCALGPRLVDQHLKGFVSLGVKIKEEHGVVIANAKNIRGDSVTFDIPTVGGTENILMAACTAKGETVINNAAREPEIIDLARALREMGAIIEGEGEETIRVQGVDALSPITYRVIQDRIEAGTYLMAVAITAGDVTIENFPSGILTSVVDKLEDAGVEFRQTGDEMRIKGPKKIEPINISTQPYPGFPTDLQAPISSLLTIADGTSVITETIFENRFAHVPELIRLGADITIDGRSAVIRGVKGLSGAKVMSSDIRNSASLILAGLAAENTTEVYRLYHLERGYERMEEKLSALGADIKKVLQDD